MHASLDHDDRGTGFVAWSAGVGLAPLLLLAAAVWAGFAIYRQALRRVNDGFWAFALAVAVPLTVLGGLWLSREGWRRRRDRAALRRLQDGAARRSGAWVAVTGRARPIEEPFQAPLSGRPALACRYRVMERAYRDRSMSSRRSSAFALRLEGYRLVPTVIESPGERVRLGGLPELSNMHDRDIGSGPAAVAEAVPGPAWPARLVARARLFLRPTDRVRADWTYGEVKTPHRTWRLEWILPPDAEVSVVGRWSPDGALLPHWSRSSGIPVYAGSPKAASAVLATEIKTYAFLGVTLFVAAGAAIAWLLAA